MTHRRFVLWMALILALVATACGGGGEGGTEGGGEGGGKEAGLTILEATFAQDVSEDMEPINPTTSFTPEQTVNLLLTIKGRPKEGEVLARFYVRDQEIASATVDLAEANEGVIFSIGENTRVYFTLTPTEPLPVSPNYRAEVFLNGSPAGTYTFAVVPPPEAIPSRLIEVTLAKGVKETPETYEPVEPTTTFAPDDAVYVVGVADMGKYSRLEVNWYVGGQLVEDATRSLTAQEDLPEAGFYFVFQPEAGWPAGEHQVVLLLNDEEVQRLTFTVR